MRLNLINVNKPLDTVSDGWLRAEKEVCPRLDLIPDHHVSLKFTR